MENKINIAELLKDCPKGMELYSPIYGFGNLTKVTDRIHVKFPKEHNVKCFRLDGKVSENGEVMIFPKGKTTWEGFQRPFKDGDIVATQNGIWIGIHKRMVGNAHEVYLAINHDCLIYNDNIFCFERLATEEEKQKLFEAIKDKGYRWNAETKTLEKLIKPKFKVGDKIIRKHRIGIDYPTEVIAVENGVYYCKGMSMGIEHQDEWELVPNKFDINTLKPFESRVLVRDEDTDDWRGAFYSHYKSKKFYTIGSSYYYQCIPYEGNEHLLGTTNDCDNFYKTW